MGGASNVLTADTKAEAIEKAKEWYKGAVNAGLCPRDYIYGKGETEIEFHHCQNKDCSLCGAKTMKAAIHVVDTNKKPEDADTEYPFPFFSKFSKDDLKKRFHVFVSAHT